MFTPETEARLSALRSVAQTRDLTTDEAKEVLKLTRADRVSASYASAGAKAKSKAIDGTAVLAKLGMAKGIAAAPGVSKGQMVLAGLLNKPVEE